jgi:acyl-coenzyme A thioesterase PaaI-like protein
LTSEPGSAGTPRYEVAPHNCFACGSLNTHGLHLELHVEPRRSWTQVALAPEFQGWDGIAHGGVVCTILDEVMAWSLAADDAWGVTARMSVDFRRPVPLGRAIRAEGFVTRMRRRLVETAGRLVNAETGEELAAATGLYVVADDARKRELRERYGFRLVPETGSEPFPGGSLA